MLFHSTKQPRNCQLVHRNSPCGLQQLESREKSKTMAKPSSTLASTCAHATAGNWARLRWISHASPEEAHAHLLQLNTNKAESYPIMKQSQGHTYSKCLDWKLSLCNYVLEDYMNDSPTRACREAFDQGLTSSYDHDLQQESASTKIRIYRSRR